MFPLRDENRAEGWPLVTMVLIAANVFCWVFLQGLGSEPLLARSVCTLGLIPGELLGYVPPGTRVPLGEGVSCVIGPPNWLSPISSMFMHGGWLHIIGNMWFLWVFGDNVEHAMGPARFLMFYLICGLAAAAAQTLAAPASPVPMVGASGAIGGVMGAYAVLFPRNRVEVAIILGFFVRVVPMPAMFMLGYWFLIQLLSGSMSEVGGGVAFWAHVGGFVAGAALAFPLARRRPEAVAALRHS